MLLVLVVSSKNSTTTSTTNTTDTTDTNGGGKGKTDGVVGASVIRQEKSIELRQKVPRDWQVALKK